MKLKAVSGMMLTLLFIGMLTLALHIQSLQAQSLTWISLNPIQIEVPAPGEWFTVDVNITNVENLAAWEFKLTYNKTLLHATYISPSPITSICYWPWEWIIPPPPEPGVIWLRYGVIDERGEWGIVWTGAVFPPGSEFTGIGTFVTINFTATEVGDCTLHLYDTRLYDSYSMWIDHGTLDGPVMVIPEFPPAIAMPLLLTATLAAAVTAAFFKYRRQFQN